MHDYDTRINDAVATFKVFAANKYEAQARYNQELLRCEK